MMHVSQEQNATRYRAGLFVRWFWFAVLLCLFEGGLQLYAKHSFGSYIWCVLLFAASLGFLTSFLCGLFPETVNRILHLCITFFYTLIFEVQIVYYQIFKGFAPLSAVAMGNDAVTNFKNQMFVGIRQSLWVLLLYLVPFAGLCILLLVWRVPLIRAKRWMFAPLAAALVLCCGNLTAMRHSGGVPTLYETIQSSKTDTDVSVYCFGMNVSLLQQARFMLFPQADAAMQTDLKVLQWDANKYQVTQIDFQALAERAADDTALQALTARLSARTPTEKNDYTGLCSGYNLIAICAEAFSPYVIDPERTPTLYHLATHGFVFDNFYNSFKNTTTNGEYAFCMGLMPDMSRTKTESSFALSSDHYLPYCYGNLFSERGWGAYAYHNYTGDFYYRNITHPNMGYQFKAVGSGLDITMSWPSSDLEMMENSLPDYIAEQRPFVSYYMTFSGHYQYDWNNPMCAKNRSEVDSLPYSEGVKAYLACNLELEKALSYLVEQLQQAGIAEKTMIVLTSDHDPYGLSDAQFSELAGPLQNDTDRYRNAFICYVPTMQEPVYVQEYCSSIDILPTVLNLLGLPYDSRLLAGEDVLAENMEHMAVLSNHSFLSQGLIYDAQSLRYEWAPDTQPDTQRQQALFSRMEEKFEISTAILNTDYYAFAFERNSDNSAVSELPGQYNDVNIMTQSAVYYMVQNGYMAPVDTETFGTELPVTRQQGIEMAYRVVWRMRANSADGKQPAQTEMNYAQVQQWALKNGYITQADTDLSQPLTRGELAQYIQRTAQLRGDVIDAPDAATSAQYADRYPQLQPQMLQAVLFCYEKGYMVGSHTGEEQVILQAANTANRMMLAAAFYMLLTR